MRDHLLLWLDTGTSIKSGGLNWFYWPRLPYRKAKGKMLAFC